MTPSGSDIVASAYKILGSPYRWWGWGASIPMWLDDGYTATAPPPAHLLSIGVECSDLVNYATWDNGIPTYAGTELWPDIILNWKPFDPAYDGKPGEVCVKGFTSEASQGHIAIYTGNGNQIIQSITNPGVTDYYDAATTATWPGCEFQWVGQIPGVDYSNPTEPPSGKAALLTPELLMKAMSSTKFVGPDLTLDNAKKYFDPLVRACKKWEINTRARLAAFLAITGGETGSFSEMSEIGEGGGRFGAYFGRGMCQLTWDYNYARYEGDSGYPVVSQPDLVASDPFIAADSAGWFWRRGAVQDFNPLADSATWEDFGWIVGLSWGTGYSTPEPEKDARYQVAWDAIPENIVLEDTGVTPPPPPPPQGRDYWLGFSPPDANGVAWLGSNTVPAGYWFRPVEVNGRILLEIVEATGTVEENGGKKTTGVIDETIEFAGEGDVHRVSGQIKISPKGAA